MSVSEATRRSMLGNRSRDTRPELLLRRQLHRLGLRFRVCARPLPRLNRTADVLLPRHRLAVFVDGCFWHGCPRHSRPFARPTAKFWAGKVARTMERDKETAQALREAGWRVLRVWEHEDPEEAAWRVLRACGL